MEQLNLIPGIILMVVIAGIVAGAGAITLGKFGDTMTECYNGSFSLNTAKTACTNSSPTSVATGCCGADGLNLSDEYYTKVKTQEGVGSISEQIPTVAIIAVMTIIIAIISGVFAYFKFFR